MSTITTHVLDTSIGGPATGVSVLLERRTGHGEWSAVGRGETNADGRLAILMPIDDPLTSGIYRMTFDTGRYFEAQGVQGFYPEVVVVFETGAAESHYHVPLLLSPFGYSTYRGT